MAASVNPIVSGGWAVGSVNYSSLPTVGDGTPVKVANIGGGTLGTGGGTWMFYSGTRYKPINNQAQLDTIDTPNTSAANASEQQLNPNHALIPANVLGTFDRLRVFVSLTKSAGVETCTFQIKFGTTGTTTDAVIATITLAAANNFYRGWLHFKKMSPTTLQLESGDPNIAFGGVATYAFPAAVAVGNMDTLGMYMSLTSTMSVGVETVTVQDYSLEWLATDSF